MTLSPHKGGYMKILIPRLTPFDKAALTLVGLTMLYIVFQIIRALVRYYV